MRGLSGTGNTSFLQVACSPRMRGWSRSTGSNY